MTTDRSPIDYRYISKRLISEIVQQNEAARSHWRVSLSTQVKVLTIGIRRLDPDYANKFDLCRRATEAVRDNTGSLELPGAYVRQELEIAPGLLTVHQGWEKRGNVEIAQMMAELEVPGVGSTVVALFGSASNYSGRRPGKELSEIPSDVDGLYEILERTREFDDLEIDKRYLEDDVLHSLESRADVVLGLKQDRIKGVVPRRLDVLMKVFYVVNDYARGNERYDRIVIGSPVWAATSAPRPIDLP